MDTFSDWKDYQYNDQVNDVSDDESDEKMRSYTITASAETELLTGMANQMSNWKAEKNGKSPAKKGCKHQGCGKPVFARGKCYRHDQEAKRASVNYASSEDEDEDDKEVEESNTSAIEAELKEYKEAVSFLKDKLHEVNILNAKLLFTNKLFKSYSLDNNQKLKVVETFDRAQTTREIKLVYSTLAEQFGDNSSIVTKKSISESASTAVSSTKPSKESKKVISEETQVANRFKKLAGLL